MDIVYIVSQILVLIAIAFLGATYLVKDKKTIMFLCIIYCIFYGTHYLLLGAITGAVMTAISAARNVWFFVNAKRDVDNSLFTLILFVGVAIVSGITSYQDVFSIVSIVASCISTYSVWQHNTGIYRWLAIPVSVCFIIYAIHINSIFSLITEFGLLIVEIIGVIRYNKERKAS